jgi:hypothetical protein
LSFDSTFTSPFQQNNPHRAKHAGTTILDDMPTLGHSKETLHEAIQTSNIKQYLTNCQYLEDEGIEIYGLKIWGTPWQPEVNIFKNQNQKILLSDNFFCI